MSTYYCLKSKKNCDEKTQCVFEHFARSQTSMGWTVSLNYPASIESCLQERRVNEKGVCRFLHTSFPITFMKSKNNLFFAERQELYSI